MNIKEWNESKRYQRYLICEYQYLTTKFIKSIWGNCTEEQRNTILRNKDLIPEFIKSIWEQCTEYQRNKICEYQHLTPEFIKSIWKECDENQRCCICRYQRLTQKSISFIWKDCDEWQREYICRYQSLTNIFIKSIFSICTEIQQNLLTTIHKNYPNKARRIQRAKDYADEHNLKIKGKYLYAFRNHKNGKGMYSKINTYKPGILYHDWHCDPRPEVKNSYGFGVWPEGNTPILVPLDKFVVEVNRDDGKARVEAFKVIK